MNTKRERHNISLPPGLYAKAKRLLTPTETVSGLVAKLLIDLITSRTTDDRR